MPTYEAFPTPDVISSGSMQRLHAQAVQVMVPVHASGNWSGNPGLKNVWKGHQSGNYGRARLGDGPLYAL